jgi:hypothetical protein
MKNKKRKCTTCGNYFGKLFFFVEEKLEQILKMGINCPWWV